MVRLPVPLCYQATVKLAPCCTLDLSRLPKCLWATELATLHQTAKAAASKKRRWCVSLNLAEAIDHIQSH